MNCEYLGPSFNIPFDLIVLAGDPAAGPAPADGWCEPGPDQLPTPEHALQGPGLHHHGLRRLRCRP